MASVTICVIVVFVSKSLQNKPEVCKCVGHNRDQQYKRPQQIASEAGAVIPQSRCRCQKVSVCTTHALVSEKKGLCAGKYRHSSTYNQPVKRSRPQLSWHDNPQQRSSPDEPIHDSHDQYHDSEPRPPQSKRPKGGTCMSRRGARVKPSPRQEEQVIDLMDSDEEAREFSGRAEPPPQLDQAHANDAQAPGTRRTRSRSGSKRALSPSSMNMDSELEVCLLCMVMMNPVCLHCLVLGTCWRLQPVPSS